QRQTILTGDQHIEHILTGQQSIRHADQPYVFFFHRTKYFEILYQPHKWHIWFCPTHKPTLRKTKRATFLPTHRLKY
ncbi:MAG: hypothetical protein MUF43_13660, partial [Flavobacterium sp.]|nr:hypothetical protein [Flavobacterium sp.]